MIWPIFIVGAVLLVLLQLWYVSRKPPLSEKEINDYLRKLDIVPLGHTKIETIEEFMRQDDGKEFCMANFVSLYQGMIAHPVTGKQVKPHVAAQEYMKHVLVLGAQKACHPVYVAYKSGGHFDSWGTDEQIDFRGLQMMRYRSRRDFMEIFTNPESSMGLDIKTAAIRQTISFPTQIQFSTFMRPHLWLSLLILLICCGLQIGFTL